MNSPVHYCLNLGGRERAGVPRKTPAVEDRRRASFTSDEISLRMEIFRASGILASDRWEPSSSAQFFTNFFAADLSSAVNVVLFKMPYS